MATCKNKTKEDRIMFVNPRRSYKSDVRESVKRKTKPVTNEEAKLILTKAFEQIRNEDATVTLETSLRFNPGGDFLTITLNGMTMRRRGLGEFTVYPDGKLYSQWLKDGDQEVEIRKYHQELHSLLKAMELHSDRFTGDDRRELLGVIRVITAIIVTITSPYPKGKNNGGRKFHHRAYSTSTPSKDGR